VISCLEIADDCYNVVVDNCTLYGSAAVGLAIHAHDLETIPWDVHILNSPLETIQPWGKHTQDRWWRSTTLHKPASSSRIARSETTLRRALISVNQVQPFFAYPSNVTIDSCVVRDNTASGSYQIEIHGVAIP